MTRTTFAALLVAGVLSVVAGCASAPAPAPSSAAPTSAAPTSGSPADVTAAVCQRFTPGAATLRTVLETARQGPVLGPAVYLLLLSPRNIAATPAIPDATVAAAMGEVVAALDELSAQAEAKLPPGADSAKTPVQLDAARAMAALAGAEKACASRSASPTTGR